MVITSFWQCCLMKPVNAPAGDLVVSLAFMLLPMLDNCK